MRQSPTAGSLEAVAVRATLNPVAAASLCHDKLCSPAAVTSGGARGIRIAHIVYPDNERSNWIEY